MAERYFSASLGDNFPSQVTEAGSSTAADPVEVRVTYDATGMDKRLVCTMLDVIKARIVQDDWPPA